MFSSPVALVVIHLWIILVTHHASGYNFTRTLPMSLVLDHDHVYFRERNDTCGSYTLEYSFFIFQVATLPPELWSECMRWATLPPSGRLPLDDPRTTLDPWPVGMPHMPFPFLQTETAHGFEQSCLYPTKRALMLVSKAWAELAVEFMYESIVIDHFGVGRIEQVLTTLGGPAGFLLKQWVKRVDIWFEDHFQGDYACEGLARIGLPNLRVQYMFLNRHLYAVPSLVRLSERPLHLVERSRSPVFSRLMSRGEVFGSLRCLTLSMFESLPAPFILPPNIRRLTIAVYQSAHFRVQDLFSTHNSFVLLNLTHLTFHHLERAPGRFMQSIELINRIGPSLRHLSLTVTLGARYWTGVDLCKILCVCTQLTELFIPYPPQGITQEADPTEYMHSNLQILGIPLMSGASEPDYRSFFDIFSRREAFPKLSTMRVMSVLTAQGEITGNHWLVPYALRLIGDGIRLEGYPGCLLPPVLVLENQN
jgi:hypothetical protein